MAISEEARHRLYGRLEEVLGADEAATMMAHLPPLGWGDVATRRDVEQQASELRAEMRELGSSLRIEMGELGGSLRAEIRGGVRSLVVSLLVLQVSAAGLVVGVASFLRA